LKKDIKVMFWDCFRGKTIIELTDLLGNLESKREEVIEQIILKYAFKKILSQILDSHPNLIFM
jgi:hypothetical protein